APPAAPATRDVLVEAADLMALLIHPGSKEPLGLGGVSGRKIARGGDIPPAVGGNHHPVAIGIDVERGPSGVAETKRGPRVGDDIVVVAGRKRTDSALTDAVGSVIPSPSAGPHAAVAGKQHLIPH